MRTTIIIYKANPSFLEEFLSFVISFVIFRDCNIYMLDGAKVQIFFETSKFCVDNFTISPVLFSEA
jgi:hypothetical protein